MAEYRVITCGRPTAVSVFEWRFNASCRKQNRMTAGRSWFLSFFETGQYLQNKNTGCCPV